MKTLDAEGPTRTFVDLVARVDSLGDAAVRRVTSRGYLSFDDVIGQSDPCDDCSS